jgi:hypothetical protein
MRTYRRWTPEMDEMLQEMFKVDCTVPEMAKVLNRNKPQVYSRLYLLDLKLSDRGLGPDKDEFRQLLKLRTGKEPVCLEGQEDVSS